MKIPERVVKAAEDAWFAFDGSSPDGMRTAITAALEEWIASGEAKHGELFVSDIDGSWSARADSYTELRAKAGITLGDTAKALIIRMEPDND